MSGDMRSAIYMGQRQIKVKNTPIPHVSEHDVLIQNMYSSICGTDVAVYMRGPDTGHRIAIGKEFGHETISRVAAVGSQVSNVQIGQRVYPYPRLAMDDISRAATID